MGGGHLLRCLALAERGRIATVSLFISSNAGIGFFHRIQDGGFAVHPLDAMYPEHGDLQTTLDILGRLGKEAT